MAYHANIPKKTTFINLLTGILHPTAGEIRINGRPRSDYRLDELQNRILYIGQEEHYLNGVLLEYYRSITRQDMTQSQLEGLLDEWNFLEEESKVRDLSTDSRALIFQPARRENY